MKLQVIGSLVAATQLEQPRIADPCRDEVLVGIARILGRHRARTRTPVAGVHHQRVHLRAMRQLDGEALFAPAQARPGRFQIAPRDAMIDKMRALYLVGAGRM